MDRHSRRPTPEMCIRDSTNTVLTTITVSQGVNGVAVSPAGTPNAGDVYVFGGGNSVSVISPTTNTCLLYTSPRQLAQVAPFDRTRAHAIPWISWRTWAWVRGQHKLEPGRVARHSVATG